MKRQCDLRKDEHVGQIQTCLVEGVINFLRYVGRGGVTLDGSLEEATLNSVLKCDQVTRRLCTGWRERVFLAKRAAGAKVQRFESV